MTRPVRPPMHPDEVPTDEILLRRLLSDQFPHWADLPIVAVQSYGTDHDIYRLGDRLSARLPRIAWADAQAELEARWLPWLAPRLPLAVPRPVALGRPALGYPYRWSVQEWLPGTIPGPGAPVDLDRAATDLAAFVAVLHALDTRDAPPRTPGSRGGPLVERDDAVRSAVDELGDRVDGVAALAVWEAHLQTPAWDGADVWLHGDLLPGNLLVADGRVSAVIDWGCLGVGDPACDLLPAWHLFESAARDTFLAALDVDDRTRRRGRGWALSQSLIALPYYWDTNPGIVRQSLRCLAAVLADDG